MNNIYIKHHVYRGLGNRDFPFLLSPFIFLFLSFFFLSFCPFGSTFLFTVLSLYFLSLISVYFSLACQTEKLCRLLENRGKGWCSPVVLTAMEGGFLRGLAVARFSYAASARITVACWSCSTDDGLWTGWGGTRGCVSDGEGTMTEVAFGRFLQRWFERWDRGCRPEGWSG